LQKTPILIFGRSRGVFHHGALGIARSAGRLGIPVHRIGCERFAPARLSRYSGSWRANPQADDESALEALRQFSAQIGPSVLIPIDDAASVFVDEHAGELAEDFLFPRQPEGLASELSSKRGMYELCQRHGISTPHSTFPQSEHDVRAHAKDSGFPVVAKCINAGLAPADSPRVAIAGSEEELLAAYRSMEVSDVGNVMLQEYVPGTPETVWMFNGYFDERSDCRIGFTGKKIRQSPPYTGATTLGACLANETVRGTTVRFMKEIGYRGILDIGYRFDARDGQYKLLDVNPRIGGTFRLFVGDDGLDVLRALHRDLTGEDVAPSVQQEGRRWIVEPLDVASSLVYLRRKDITLPQWLRSLRHVRETAWFAADDPLPFFALWPCLLLDRLKAFSGRRAP
jgi:D-aspartate ligase